VIILGIDTALRCSGYGVVEAQASRFKALDCGVIRTPAKQPHSQCLARLGGGIEELLKQFHPTVAVIEGGFFSRNVKTAMVLGMARGVVVGLCARHDVPIYEYAPRKAKQVVTGFGGADKARVATAMANLLHLDVREIPEDSTDAMALAVCHGLTCHTHQGLFLPAPL